jgi:hypothetical protein
MRDDLRFDRYLWVRARGIELPPANLASVIDRAARRHRHRRAAVSACTAVAVLTAAVSVSSLDGRPATDQVTARAAGGLLVDSPLAWNVVTPRSALTFSKSTVTGPDDRIYSLSTAPGAVGPDDASPPPTLYQSVDGIEWSSTELPPSLHASSLASTSRVLYAIGTAPAGGNLRAVQLASTTGAGAPWQRVTLPIDVASLEARHAVQIGLGRLAVASDENRVVVAVRLQVVDGLDRLLTGIDLGGGYRFTQHGIDVFTNEPGPDKQAVEALTPEARDTLLRARKMPTVAASYTWQQLGIDDALRSLVLGETRVFVADDGHTFRPAELPQPVRSFGGLFATATGFRMFGSSDSSASQIEVWQSADGQRWVADPSGQTAGYLMASGIRQGRVALVTANGREPNEHDTVVKVEQADGSWSEFGVVDLLRQAGVEGEVYSSTAAVGPLGVAVVVTRQLGDTAQSYLVTTADGIEASVIALAPLAADSYANDVRVTADAITVTMTGSGADRSVRLVVGTPNR